jgi:hypothetical protein
MDDKVKTQDGHTVCVNETISGTGVKASHKDKVLTRGDVDHIGVCDVDNFNSEGDFATLLEVNKARNEFALLTNEEIIGDGTLTNIKQYFELEMDDMARIDSSAYIRMRLAEKSACGREIK